MVFSSLHFMIFFLPAVLLLYLLAPKKWKNIVLLLSSLFFYGWGEPQYLLLMVTVITIGYFSGIWMNRYPKGSRQRTMVVAATIVLDLLFLGFFKYADFVVENLNYLFGWQIPELNIPLPLGISFYIFQTMSYTIDVYREDASTQKSWLKFGTYVSMFPQLVAGPIVRYRDIEEELEHRSVNIDDVHVGVERFIIGLSKKVIIANPMGLLNTTLLGAYDGPMPVATAWLSLLAFTLQIYFDFSGYSDMAIGLGRIFGFHFMENFNYPYISTSITEFWRRWHISLSTWFKEYVYIPLGGNRVSVPRWALNLLIVWFLTGLWHGAHWNFVLWGLYYFILLFIEKMFIKDRIGDCFQSVSWLVTFLLVMFSWNLFQFTDFQELVIQTKNLFGIWGIGWVDTTGLFYFRNYAVLIFIGLVAATPFPKSAWLRIKEKSWGPWFTDAVLVIFFVLCIAQLVKYTYNPFLYFRF